MNFLISQFLKFKFHFKFQISNYKLNYGFTLIELLVVLGITSLLFLFGVSNYRDFNRRQQLSEAAKILRQDLLLAQQRALSGEKSVCPTPLTNTLLGYGITFSAASYQLFADCLTGTDPVVKTVNLPGGITKSAGATSVTFKTLAQGTTDVSNTSITLSQSSSGKTAVVTVSRTGSVSITVN